MVLPQDSEMSYVTYMFTLYNSPLPGLKAQTQFYSDVLHISLLQVCQHSRPRRCVSTGDTDSNAHMPAPH
jgi:hypothetical protein